MGSLIVYLLFSFILFLGSGNALDNGLALTPPMGWLSWERFRCNIDCVNDPDNCISERLYMQMADRLIADGWRNVGYEYVNIDDCWAEKKRDSQGRLVADHQRFPHGIKYLADYMHDRGLKLGIYGDYGTYTCGGYPGSIDYLQIDADTWAEWGVDSVKLDGCYVDIDKMNQGYPLMSKYLNETGRPMLFSCSWPAYYVGTNKTIDWASIKKNCNLWRNYDDIQDSYDSVRSIWEWFGDNQKVLAPLAAPGSWNDPDMLICGDFSLSDPECESQFAIWAVIAAPLYMSNDLRDISPAAVRTLQNKEIIAVNQDPLGMQGIRIQQSGPFSIWKRSLYDGSLFVVLLSSDDGGTPTSITITSDMLGLSSSQFSVRDLFAQKDLGDFSTQFSAEVVCHGARGFKITSL